MRLGVNAFETRRRIRVWSGGSRLRMARLPRRARSVSTASKRSARRSVLALASTTERVGSRSTRLTSS